MTHSLTILILFFFFNDTATTEIYTLSLHDALPISPADPGAEHAAREVEPDREARARGDGHRGEGNRGAPEDGEYRHEEQARISTTEHEPDRTLGGRWEAKCRDAILGGHREHRACRGGDGQHNGDRRIGPGLDRPERERADHASIGEAVEDTVQECPRGTRPHLEPRDLPVDPVEERTRVHEEPTRDSR